MSITLTDRHGVVVKSSTVAWRRRWRVARPRCPGTRPSVVTASAGSEGESTGTKSSLAAVTDRPSGARPRRRARVAGLLGPAVRAAIVVPAAFALARAVTPSSQTQLFAAFGSFALAIFASFPGGRRRQLRSLTALVVVGMACIALGTACSETPVAAVAAMAAVGFAVLFAGILGPQATAGTVAALLAFVLPVAVAAPPGEIPARLAGWLLAAALVLPATVLLWPRPGGHELRRHLAATARALAAVASAHAAGRLDGDAVATATAELASLRDLFGSSSFPPTGAGPEDSALGKLVGRMEWLAAHAVVAPAQAAALELPDVSRVHAAVADVLSATAAAVEAPRLVGDAGAGRLAAAKNRLHAALLDSQDRSLDRLLDGTAERRAAAVLDGGSAAATVDADPGAGRLLQTLDPTFQARMLAFAALMVADAATEASRRGRLPTAAERRRERSAWGSGRTAAAAHVDLRSVWFRNSLRGAAGLALAVAVVEVTNVEHGFWVILGTLSVLRSNALGTGATVVRAMAGTVVGFALGSAVMLGLANHTDLLWAVLPVAVLVSAIAPTAISFAAGQAAFTVVVVVLFNIIEPVGWRVGLTRIEDVAIGCSVSLAVCLLFWPRGAASALGRALSDAYAAGSDYLQRAVERTTSVVDDVDTEPERLAGEGPFRRLDDAFRQYVAERGAKPVAPAVATHLVTGASRTRIAAYSLATLPRRPVDETTEPLPSVAAAGDALREAGEEVRRWYRSAGQVLAGGSAGGAGGGAAAVPEVHPHGGDVHRLLAEAFREASARHRAADVRAVLRMLWADESLEDELALSRDLHAALAEIAPRPSRWNRF